MYRSDVTFQSPGAGAEEFDAVKTLLSSVEPVRIRRRGRRIEIPPDEARFGEG